MVMIVEIIKLKGARKYKKNNTGIKIILNMREKSILKNILIFYLRRCIYLYQ